MLYILYTCIIYAPMLYTNCLTPLSILSHLNSIRLQREMRYICIILITEVKLSCSFSRNSTLEHQRILMHYQNLMKQISANIIYRIILNY